MRFALLVAVASIAAAIRLPDVTKGSIDGRIAVIVWPRLDGKLIEPDQCSAHLVPVTNPDSELSFPCGDWFQPPAGTYRIWLEQRDLISPLQNLLTYSGGPFKGRGLAAIFDVAAGGKVRLTRDSDLAATNQLRLLNLESHLRLGTLGRAFERRLPGAKARQPVVMPSGPVIAAITDLQGNALAVSRPFTVRERETIDVRARPPDKGTDVLVVLARARTASLEQPDNIRMTLELENRSLPPDVFVSAADRFYGVWYGVDAPRAVFQIASSTMALPPEEIRLRPRSVATLRRTLKALPSAKISVRAPAGAFDGLERSIELVAPSQRVVRQVRLSADDTTVESLPAELLTVFLTIGPWRFAREVDLSGYEDRDVVFDLQPILVNGRVYRGRDPAAGVVKFHVAREWISTETDDEGRYQITLWEPQMYVVEIDLRNDRAPPFREFFVEIDGSGTRDFRIPDSRYVVHVTNADSGAPIPAAEVVVTNNFRVGDAPEQSISQKAVSDERGDALLPPLRPGSVRVLVRAAGYLESAPAEVPVEGGAEPRSLSIGLRAEEKGTRLVLNLPNGIPCANAEILAVPNNLSDTVLWQGTTAADGSIDVPRRLAGAVLLVRHSGAASLARLWRPSDDESPVTWGLSRAAAPLSVKASDAAGDGTAFAHVVVWIDGIALRGRALRYLAGAAPVTDGYGHWRAANLGGQSYEIVVMRHLRMPVVRSLAEPLRVPWPSEVAVRVVE